MKRLQNKVAESRFTLPIASLYGAVVWVAAGLVSQSLWIPFLLMALSTYLMAEVNNRNALIRIRSRMVSTAFLFLTMMGVSLYYGEREATVQLCFIGFLLFLFQAYQDKTAVGAIFSAFLLIGISSLAFVQMLWFVPLLAILVARPIYAMSVKGVSAIVLGTLLPYWFAVPYLIYIGDTDRITEHFMPLIDMAGLFDYSQVTVGLLTEYLLLIALGVLGWVHFVRTAYRDKIRTRMFLNAFVAVFLVCMAVIPVMPSLAHSLMPVMIVGVSPLVAHFITLTEKKSSNYVFMAILATVVLITLIGVFTDWLQTPLGLDRIHIVIEK